MASSTMSAPQIPTNLSSEPTGGSDFNLVHDAEVLINAYLPPESAAEAFVSGFRRRTIPHPDPQRAGAGEQVEPWPLPFCLPQLTSSRTSTFARGYNAELENVELSQETILKFVDGLNLAMTASPPLRIVDTTGKVIGFVYVSISSRFFPVVRGFSKLTSSNPIRPYHWAQIASAVIQVSAQTAIHVISKSLTDRYIRAANKRIFHPRGLSVRLCSTPAMMSLITGIPTIDSDPKWKRALQGTGRFAGTALLKLPLPLTSHIVRAIADPAPKLQPLAEGSNPMNYNTSVLRRLQLPGEHALTVNLNVPKPAKPEGVVDKMQSWGQKLDEWKAKRSADNSERNRRIVGRVQARTNGEDPSVYGTAPPGSMEAALEWREQRHADINRLRGQIGRRGMERGLGLGLGDSNPINKILGPSRETPLERRTRNEDLIAKWSDKSVLWIVIMKKDVDEEIAGIEMADSQENEEKVDDATWREVIALETQQNDVDDDEQTAVNLGLRSPTRTP
jgi:hypothetical protein